MRNIEYYHRIYPCRSLAGRESDECLPAPDYVDPVAVGSLARAKVIAQALLYNTDGGGAVAWNTVKISTLNNNIFPRGGILRIRNPDGSETIGVIKEVQLFSNLEGQRQELVLAVPAII